MKQRRANTAKAARSLPGSGGLPHLVIEQVTPQVDGGRHSPKRVVGGTCEVGAAIFKDGHDLLAARVRYRGPGDGEWRAVVAIANIGRAVPSLGLMGLAFIVLLLVLLVRPQGLALKTSGLTDRWNVEYYRRDGTATRVTVRPRVSLRPSV